MTNEREKSDSATVAGKPTNKAERSAAEPRAGTEGNAGQQSTRRAQDRESVSQALERVRQAVRFAVKHPRKEPDAGNPLVRMCVQRRLACSAGDKPAGVEVRAP